MVRGKIKIVRVNREDAVAWALVIISASRSTDILAFYSDWFFHRLKVGYSRHTFSGQVGYVSYERVKCMVFGSKKHLTA